MSQVATTATGNYTIGNLPSGTYEIDVTVAGFKKYVRTGLMVQELQTIRVDVALEIGSSTESVTVTESAPLLKTETGDVSHNVTSNTVNDLPTGALGAIRNTLTVSQLMPGTNVVGPNTLRISGTPVNSEQVRIDGLDATYSLGMSTYSFASPSVDSVQEIAVQTSNYAAEYGQAGGAVFNMTMKSGTNQFHGIGIRVLGERRPRRRRRILPHRSQITEERLRRYGRRTRMGSQGLQRQGWKTFFFFSYESSPTTTVSSNTLDTVPTAAYRIGNFSAAEAATNNKVLGTRPLGRSIIQNAIYDPLSQRSVAAGLIRVRSPEIRFP